MVLCYHGVREGFEPAISSVPAERLARQLDYLLGRGFRPAAFDSESPGPGDLSVTLDDALASQVETWAQPLLDRGIRATLFVPAGFVGARASWDYVRRSRRHATWSQLLEWCSLGHSIGSHGMHHRDLRTMTHDDLQHEVADSRKLLEDRLGVAVTSLAYPFGRFSSTVVRAVQEAGYTSAFTAQPRAASTTWTRSRILVSWLDTELSLEARMQSSLWGSLERGKQRLITFWSGGTALQQAWFQRMERAAA